MSFFSLFKTFYAAGPDPDTTVAEESLQLFFLDA